ncbi:MAG: HU family DNA-binding protein, partial [Lachnospiraceae bacterium]|nr:HU family DNA-binding protein [Lachnospiraceae bacterium]
MNRKELVDAIARETGLSRKNAEFAVRAFVDIVSEELRKGEK